MVDSPVAGMVCGAMCVLCRPLTALAPKATQRIDANIACDGVAHIWPAHRDALDSLLEDNPLADWFADPPLPTTVALADADTTVTAADVEPLLRAGVRRLPGTHLLPVEHPDEIAEAVLAGT